MDAVSSLLPPSISGDASRIVTGRAVRGFADGFVSVLLAQYLTGLGFSPIEVGAIVTGTLVGSAALTLGFGFTAHRFTLRSLLLVASPSRCCSYERSSRRWTFPRVRPSS